MSSIASPMSSPTISRRRASPIRSRSILDGAEALETLRVVESAVQAAKNAAALVQMNTERAERGQRHQGPPLRHSKSSTLQDITQFVSTAAKQLCQQASRLQTASEGTNKTATLSLRDLATSRASRKVEVGAVERSRSFHDGLLGKLKHLQLDAPDKGIHRSAQLLQRSAVQSRRPPLRQSLGGPSVIYAPASPRRFRIEV